MFLQTLTEINQESFEVLKESFMRKTMIIFTIYALLANKWSLAIDLLTK